ncbi:MAG: hypothetical protein K8T26_13485 [Lentisphaerae bacterium]|nr:hypothetical protein [Lentisphaerota bacterium]
MTGRSLPSSRVPLALALLLLPGVAPAQNYRARYARVEEPALFKYQLYGLEAGAQAQHLHQVSSFRDSDNRATYDRSYVTPSIGAGTIGSIYHPDFIKFDLWGQAAYGWGEEESDTGDTITRNQISHFERFRARMDVLADKPLNGTAKASYGRSYRDYDFFTRTTVETLGYGAQLRYRAPTISSGLSYSHSDENETNTQTPSSTRQDLVTYSAQTFRRHGGSALNYSYTESDFSGAAPESDNLVRNHSISLSNQERFGPGERRDLQTEATYSHQDSTDTQNDQFTANTTYRVDHSRTLGSIYDASYDRFTTDNFVSENLNGRASLWHQLYESLRSTVSAEGSDSESTADGEDAYSRRLGGSVTEAYTKRLGDLHRLRLDAGGSLDDNEQTGSGRAVNEGHRFPSPPDIEAFFLDLPSVVDSSIVVKDAGDIRRFSRGTDYEVLQRGTRTEIRRIPGGNIPEGSAVLVSYDAAPGVPGSYQSWTETLGVRLELWRNLWGLYGRLSYGFNNAPDNLAVQELKLYTAGSDVNLSHARAGVEYQIYDSEDAYDRSTRFFQSAWMNPDDVSTISISLAQSFTEHVDEDRRERDYRYTTTYRRSVTRRLHVAMSAGLDFRRGEGVDQDLTVLRPEVNYRIGQTTMEAYYDYEHNLYLKNEERDKHLLAAELKRRF